MVAPIHHQVVIYAADPQRLARFWAAAMGYELENNEVMIEPLLAAGVAQESDTVVVDGQRFWDGILAIRWRLPSGTEIDTGFRGDDRQRYADWLGETN